MCSFKFSLVTALLLVSQHGTLAQVISFRGSAPGGGLFGGPDGESGVGDLSTGELPASGYPGETNGYLPPLGGSPSSGVPAFVEPPRDNTGREDSPTNQNPTITKPPQPEAPVVRTPPQVGCAAALLCVEEQYCSMTGIISRTPITLTENQKLRQVPMVDCKNPDNGVIGKCCRDPDYVDPWPAGNLPTNYSGGFDEQGFPKFLNLSKNKPKSVRPVKPSKGFSQQATNALPQPDKVIPQNPVKPFIPPKKPAVILEPQQSIQVLAQPQQPIQPIDTFQSQPTFESKKVLEQPRPFQLPQVIAEPPRPAIMVQEVQPAKINGKIEGDKTFSFPTLQGIPNPIAGLNPFLPQGSVIAQFGGDNQAILNPADAQVQSEVTTKKPFLSNFPNFPSISVFQKEKDYAPIVNVPIIAPHTPGSQCGIINQVQYAGDLRNVEVPFGTIPWQAMILSNSQKKLLCSGAVVAPNLIMTTAHCVYGINPSDISIKVGEWKLGYELKHEEPLPFEIVQVESVVAHPNYQPGAAGFDIAMLFLEHSVKLDQHVDTICVPGQAPAVTPQRKCISVGWGKTILQLHAAGALMHKIDVDVLSREECEQRLQGAESPLELHDSLVCVKAHKQSDNMCMVDVGGPLACDRGDGIYELVGVYSKDTGCLPTNQVATFALMDFKWVNTYVGSASALIPTTVDYVQKPVEQPQQPQQPNRVYYPSNLPPGANQYLPPV